MPNATNPKMNPWHPMAKAIDLKHLGKLAEEVNELGSAVARCIIQGIDENEPVTEKPNREWIEDEMADVMANIELVVKHFALDGNRIVLRAEAKRSQLKSWHDMA